MPGCVENACLGTGEMSLGPSGTVSAQRCFENRGCIATLRGWDGGCSLEVRELRKPAGSAVPPGCRAVCLQRQAWRCQRKTRSLGSPTHRLCIAIGVVLPVPLPTGIPHTGAADRDRQARCWLQASRCCVSPLPAPPPAAGGMWLAQSFGRSLRSWEGILPGAVVLCALKSFSPSLAVLGCGDLVWE